MVRRGQFVRRAVWALTAAVLLEFHFIALALPSPPVLSVTLTWNASPDPTVAGYNLYYCDAKGLDIGVIDVGTNIQSTLNGLAPGDTYGFAVASYNTNGLEGPLTPEVVYVVPFVLKASLSSTNNAIDFNFPMIPGHIYHLQASPDLKTWSNIWTNTSKGHTIWANFSDPITNSYAARFYRLVSQSETKTITVDGDNP